MAIERTMICTSRILPQHNGAFLARCALLTLGLPVQAAHPAASGRWTWPRHLKLLSIAAAPRGGADAAAVSGDGSAPDPEPELSQGAKRSRTEERQQSHPQPPTVGTVRLGLGSASPDEGTQGGGGGGLQRQHDDGGPAAAAGSGGTTSAGCAVGDSGGLSGDQTQRQQHASGA